MRIVATTPTGERHVCSDLDLRHLLPTHGFLTIEPLGHTGTPRPTAADPTPTTLADAILDELAAGRAISPAEHTR